LNAHLRPPELPDSQLENSAAKDEVFLFLNKKIFRNSVQDDRFCITTEQIETVQVTHLHMMLLRQRFMEIFETKGQISGICINLELGLSSKTS
jgi:hypothetical protein